MTLITSSLKSKTFVYDFATDGGAQGSINMGLFIPARSVIWFGFANVITALTSGGMATIAVGFSGSTGALITATAVASWSLDAILPGVDLPATPLKLTAIQQLQVTIATADLLTGKFEYTVVYNESSI